MQPTLRIIKKQVNYYESCGYCHRIHSFSESIKKKLAVIDSAVNRIINKANGHDIVNIRAGINSKQEF